MTDAWENEKSMNDAAHVSYSAFALLIGILKQMEQAVTEMTELRNLICEAEDNLHMHLYDLQDDIFEANFRLERMEERNFVDDGEEESDIDAAKDDVQF